MYHTITTSNVPALKQQQQQQQQQFLKTLWEIEKVLINCILFSSTFSHNVFYIPQTDSSHISLVAS